VPWRLVLIARLFVKEQRPLLLLVVTWSLRSRLLASASKNLVVNRLRDITHICGFVSAFLQLPLYTTKLSSEYIGSLCLTLNVVSMNAAWFPQSLSLKVSTHCALAIVGLFVRLIVENV
jgi:hypothetical protein